MRSSSRGPSRARAPAWLRGALLAAALLPVAGCERLDPGAIGPPSYVIYGWEVVSQEAAAGGRTRYALRGWCSNAGPDSDGAAGVAVSRSPDLVVIEDQIRCGPVARRGREPTLDTITVEHLGAQPFDPFEISGAMLVWGAETKVSETRAGDTRSDVVYSADLINATREAQTVVGTVTSRSPEIEIVDDTVTGRVPAEKRFAAVDGFAIRHDRDEGYDPNALVWRLRLGAREPDADFDGSGAVEERDVAQIEACRGTDPVRGCECARADLDGDATVDAADVAIATSQLGRSGLPVRASDTTPPVVTISSPAAGTEVSASTVAAAGTIDEPVFRLLVNGVDAQIEAGDPPLRWTAQAPVPIGSPVVVARAIDRACNAATASVALGAGADRIAPVVGVVAPAQVGAGQALRVVADARDDVGVASVELFIDDASAGVRAAAPFVFDVVAPATPGATLALRAVAHDAAGNRAQAAGAVLVVDAGSDAPPSVGALRLPASVAPGARFVVGAAASDDRGVAEVRFSVAGGASATAVVPPYQVELVAPPGVQVGERLGVTVDAVDGAGQTAHASGTIAIVAQGDRSLPRVVLDAPEEAPPGAEVRLVASAQDDQGVAWVLFYADGVMLIEGVAPPHEVRVRLPADRRPGEIVVWTAVAVDFAGNAGSSVATVTRIVEAQAGFANGEVYDDATSRPLAGARVRATRAAGAPVEGAVAETTSDERGAYRLALPPGPALLEIVQEGYTRAWRVVDVPPSGVATPLDARLAPRAPPVSIDRPQGGAVEAAGGVARLVVPPGALAASGAVALTRTGPQALALPLPPGWTPLGAFEVEAAGFAAPAMLVLEDDALANAPVAARFDSAAGAWRSVAIEPGGGGERHVSVSSPGVVALARPDAVPAAPPLPDPGALLAGVSPVEIPEGAAATLLPAPRIVFAAADARADVTVRLAVPAPLPSGTPIEVRFREAYDQSDGSRVEPPPSAQDFLLFAEPEGPAARFVAAPVPGLDPGLLAEGVIELVAQTRPAAAPALVGPEGGRLETPGGVSLEIAPGALGERTPSQIAPVAASAAGLPADDRYDVLGGVDVDLGGSVLAASAVLRFPLAVPPAAGEQILLVRPITVLGRAELELAGVAMPSGNAVLVGAGGAGLPLSGIRSGGRYVLVRMRAPAGFVAGEATRAGALAADVLVRADTLPFVSRTRAGDARYAVAAKVGAAHVEGLDLASGDGAAAQAQLAAGGEVASRDLALAPHPLAVVEVDPPGGAADVAVASPVTLRFSAPVDPATLGAESVSLRRGGESVAAVRSLTPDRVRVVLAPAVALAGGAAHEISVGVALRDVFGRSLATPFTSAFTTVDTTPPPRPAPGIVTLSMPLGGVSDVRGAPGAVPPGTLVTARNLTQGAATSVLAGPDGSFFLRVAAEASDTVRLLVIGAGGSATDLGAIPFSDGEGGFMIGPEGGEAASGAGVVARLRPRALLAPALVRIADRAAAELEAPLPAGVVLAQGFSLDFDATLLNQANALEVGEAAGRFPQRGAFSPPLRVEATRIAPATTGLASRFTFTATSRDAQGAERVVAIEAEGRTAACNETCTVRDDAAAPALALTAPRCLGPEEAFTLRAEAVQPRVEIAAPRPAGTASDATWLVLRAQALGSERAWRVDERLAVGSGLQLVTDPLAPFGLRESGGYWIVRAPASLAWIEGRADGDVLVGAEGSPFVARAGDPGGAFLLPVPSGQPLVLRRIDAATGAELSRRAIAALAAGETRSEARLGDDGVPALAVAVRTGPGGRVHGRGPIAFEFSQPVSVASVTPESVVVTDSSGRAVAAERRLVGDGSRVELIPDRPWRFGESYAYRITMEVAGIGGSRLAADQAGAFDAFLPSVVARLPGTDVRDAAVASPLAYALDAGRLRPLDLTSPSAPVEGARLDLGAATSRLLRHVAQGSPLLLAAGGGGAEYGAVQRIAIVDPLRPVLAALRRLSTPEGEPAVAGVDPRPGIPSALAPAGDAAVVATQGIGLQRLLLADGLGPAPPEQPPSYPPGGASYAAVAGDEGLVVSVTGAVLTLHDPASLSPLATAAITGAARDVVLARVAGRRLALVAAGLPGGVQTFVIQGGEEIAGGVGPASPAQVTRAGQVLPGCAVTRLAVDAPLQRAWFACTNGKLGVIDLAGADGVDPIDRDRDGLDDRIAGLVDLSIAPSSPLALDLDEGRALGLVSAGSAGLVLAQLGPAEAVITDVRRDVLPGDRDDESSIFATGRAFHGDQAIVAHVEARIPPGHPGLRAVLGGDAPLVFEGGAREIAVAAGTQRLRLVPVPGAAAAASFSIAIVEDAEPLAAFAGAFSPVPVDALVSVDGDDIVADGPGPHPIVISGVGADDVLYDLTPLARLELADPAIGAVGADGSFTAAAGGESEIVYEVAGRRQSLLAKATLPPAIGGLAVDPQELRLALGGSGAVLEVTGLLSDGESRPLTAADGIVFSSSKPGVAGVDASGRVLALSAGQTQIRVAAGDADAVANVSVYEVVRPEVTGLDLRLDRSVVNADVGAVGASARIQGTGTLEGLEVEFVLEGLAADQTTQRAAALAGGGAPAIFTGLSTTGSGRITARITAPGTGRVFTASADFTVIARNIDLEPNDTPAGAGILESAAIVAGQVGGGDAADVFAVARELPGTWRITLSGEGVRASVLGDGGAVFGPIDAGGPPLVVEAPASESPLLVTVTAATGPAAYQLSARLDQATPIIESIAPPAAPPGAAVVIRGRNFGTRERDHLVAFGDLRLPPRRVSPTEIEAVVPAFARNGRVSVWSGRRESEGVPFSTGLAGQWSDDAVVSDPAPGDFVTDARTGETIVRERIEVAFERDVLRPRAQAIAAAMGAEIVGVWPPRNAYHLRFAGADTVVLRTRLETLRALPEVRYANLLAYSESDAFPIAGRDDFPDRSIPANPSRPSDARLSAAYAQIHAFEAWQAVADSGFFSGPGAGPFAAIRVGVLDFGLVPTPISAPQLVGTITPQDFKVQPGWIQPSKYDHGTHVSALIGARNVDDSLRRSTGILGGLVPADAPLPPFYSVDLYDTTFAGVDPKTGHPLNDSREIEYALEGCGAVAPECSTTLPMNIANLSLGSYKDPADIGDSLAYYKDLVRARPTTLFVTAAGNDNNAADRHSPSALTLDADVGDRVIAVGAVSTGFRVTSGGRRPDIRASFSNYGPAVDVAAPGEGVLSVNTDGTVDSDGCKDAGLPANNPYDYFCGTSAATPLVTGVAAMVQAIDPSLTAAETKRLIIDSATPLDGVPKDMGFGMWAAPRRLDALRAVQMALRHRGAAAATGAAPAQYLPGLRRYLWILDRPRSRLIRVLVKTPFERTLSADSLVIDEPVDLLVANCRQPYAVQPSASGDKVYVACRGTNQILVWHANTNAEADFTVSPATTESWVPLEMGSTTYRLAEFPSIQMALSRDGQILAIPLQHRKVAFLDTRSDRIVDVKTFRGSVNVGALRALAFGANDTLYALTTDDYSGQLVRKPRSSTMARWRIDQRDGFVVTDLGEPFASPPSRGPSGLTVVPRAGEDHVYVLYGDDKSVAAATVHRGSDLALVDPPGSPNGRIRSNIPDRVAQQFAAGDMVGFPLGTFYSRARLMDTATSGVRAMAIDPLRGLAYMVFHGTGNLALLKANPATGSFQALTSATRMLGSFVEPRTEQKAALETQLRADGTIDTQIEDRLTAREERLYYQDDFPVSFAMDQEGGLLAAHLAGTNPRLRMWATAAIAEGQRMMEVMPFDPTDTTLDTAVDQSGRLDVPLTKDFDVTSDASPSIAFGNTLVTAAPASGAITRGVLAVHPVIRDWKIYKIRCEVRNASNGALVRSDAGTTIPSAGQTTGFPERVGVADTGTPVPVCRFPDLPKGAYVLRVIAGTLSGTGDDIVSETPFLHEAW